MSHPSDDDIELYLLEPEGHALDAHLAECAHCRERLERSARLELQLYEVARAADCLECARPVEGKACGHCGALRYLDGYQLESIKVHHARGRLYVGRDAQARRVAIKELVFAHAPGLEAVLSFEREAKILGALEHPAIPRFVASFTTGEGVHTRMYLVQELVDGESLLERLQHHQFSEPELVKLTREVLTIVEYLQLLTPRVFHRDVKPANLVRRSDGTVALVDFGSARDLGATVGATLVGTFGYMPVEQLTGLVDATTDLYAIGMTVLHLATRTEPWQLDARTRARASLSRRFQAFLTKLTAAEPAQRYPTAAAALHALDAPPQPTLDHRRMVIGCTIGALGAGSLTYVGYRLLQDEALPRPEVRIVKPPIRLPPRPASNPGDDSRPLANYRDRVPPVCEGGACTLWVDAPLNLDGIGSEKGWLERGVKRPRGITVEAWVRPDPQITLVWDPVTVGITGTRQWATIENGSTKMSVANDSSHQVDSAWHHVAVTYDGATARLYLDAVEIASSRCQTDCAPAGLQRGIRFGGGGVLDDVRLWSVARTASQVRTDRDGPVAARSPGLVSSFTFDGDRSLPVQDELDNNGPLSPTPPPVMRKGDVSRMVVRVREATPRGDSPPAAPPRSPVTANVVGVWKQAYPSILIDRGTASGLRPRLEAHAASPPERLLGCVLQSCSRNECVCRLGDIPLDSVRRIQSVNVDPPLPPP